MFVVIEGIDGAGKSTMTNLLVKHLAESGLRVFQTREVGGTPVGEEMRSILVKNRPESDEQVLPLTQFCLAMGARIQHAENFIKPRLQEGWVVSDRYVHSTMVYQCLMGGVDSNLLYDIAISADLPVPDILIYLAVPPDVSVARQRDLLDKDHLDLQFMNQRAKLDNAYREALCLLDPDSFYTHIVDASQPQGDVLKDMLLCIEHAKSHHVQK